MLRLDICVILPLLFGVEVELSSALPQKAT